MPGDLRLRPLRDDDERAVRAAQDVMAASDDFPFALFLEPDTAWSDYLDALVACHRDGPDLPPDRVWSSFLVAEVGGAIVGRASIRHAMNDFLASEGGHIGYGVLPDHRGRGYATEILRQSIVIARAHGTDRLLLTVTPIVLSLICRKAAGHQRQNAPPILTVRGGGGWRRW